MTLLHHLTGVVSASALISLFLLATKTNGFGAPDEHSPVNVLRYGLCPIMFGLLIQAVI